MDKEQLIEKYRDINVDYDWWESIVDNFKEEMYKIGIDVDEVYFDLYRGSNVCFDGGVANWYLFLNSIGYNNKILIDLAREQWYCKVRQAGRYYDVDFEIDLPNPIDTDRELFAYHCSPYDKDDLRTAAWLAVLETFDYEEIEEKIKDAITDHMHDLHRALRREYEHLTSDEAVWEAIVANDLVQESEDEEVY